MLHRFSDVSSLWLAGTLFNVSLPNVRFGNPLVYSSSITVLPPVVVLCLVESYPVQLIIRQRQHIYWTLFFPLHIFFLSSILPYKCQSLQCPQSLTSVSATQQGPCSIWVSIPWLAVWKVQLVVVPPYPWFSTCVFGYPRSTTIQKY